jgi:hypothetical protein
MAADPHHQDVPSMDYSEHEKTFGLFASLVKWGTVVSLALMLLAGAASGTISWIFFLAVTAALVAVVVKFF